jgi:hypothetical protein
LDVERDLALPVRSQHSRVEGAHAHHVAESGQLLVGREVRIPLADRLPVVVEHAHQLLAHQGHALDLLVERRLLHFSGVAHETNRFGFSVPARRFGDAKPKRFTRPIEGVTHAIEVPTTAVRRTFPTGPMLNRDPRGEAVGKRVKTEA